MPSKKQVVWNVPHRRNRFFTGRSQVLDDLGQALAATRKAALSGLGGVGKTQTAVEYAYRHRGEYGAVLWAKADTEDSLNADFAAIAAKLNLPEKDETDREKVIDAVKRWLDGHDGWLLILDNADDLGLISDLLSREWDGHLLLTTRAFATGDVTIVEVAVMPPEEGTLFLLRRAKLIELDDALGAATESDQDLAAEITRDVGGLPLALDQAGAFIEEGPSSLAEYLDLYRRAGVELRAKRGGFISDHEPVTITFSLAFGQVASTSAAAADMLRACAFLAPDAIPEEIFVSGAGELGENLSPMAGGGINLVKMMGEAGRFSLLRRNAKNGTIEIHRVVQQVLKDEMDAATRRIWAERVVQALNSSFPEVEHKNWLLCEKLLPHAQESARLIGEYSFEFLEAVNLLTRTGNYCYVHAQLEQAESLFVHALNISEKAFGPDHPDVSVSLNNLAALYERQGKYAKAEPLYVRALSMRERAFKSDDPRLATSLNNLALLYDLQGKYAEAEPLYARALSIREKAFRSDHPDVAASLNNLAGFYKGQGKYEKSETLYVRSLDIYEKVLGQDHPDLATSLNNLAFLYKTQGKYAEAEPLYVRALNIREKAFGPDHPDVAASLNNLAALYEGQGKFAEAEPLFVRSLEICEKVFEPDHPHLATTLNNLAALYDSQGKYAEAGPLYVRALSIREKVLGSDHPDVALGLNNLAVHYYSKGKHAEAEPLLVRALNIREKGLGPDHPDVGTSLYNLAALYKFQGKYTEAEPLYVRSMGIYEKVLGPDHPNTLIVRENYNALLQKMRNNTEE